jgi:hypothetical protein
VSNITLAWLAISLPLVLWDTLYILLRPHTMEGGAIQWPIWKPYEIYASIDHVYGKPGWDNKDGFGGGQGVMNAVETVLYGLYAMIVWNHGAWAEGGSGLQVGEGVKGWLSGGVKVRGAVGNKALLIGFSASLMTLTKTVLYCECFKAAKAAKADEEQISWSTFLILPIPNTTTGSRSCSSTAS